MHKPKQRNRRSPQKSIDWLEYMNNCLPRLVVPVGPRFQADVPEWKGPFTKASSCDGDDGSDTSSRWLGTQAWPIKDSHGGDSGGGNFVKRRSDFPSLVAKSEKIGKGRSDSCRCSSPGSPDCIKRHIAEAQKRLRFDLGPAFTSWKFDEMGENVAKTWTTEEEKRFEFFVRMNPASQGRSLFRPAITSFPSKTREDIVSYYLNVYLPRRISMKNESGCMMLDSDDEVARDSINAGKSQKDLDPLMLILPLSM
ncbi:hypothetical protein Nepgr_014565 [Nepenthes gracilis]|uniref:Uncharacterized protein n=1 Tax=Nepenthes gracilis TaxID=150966 RepID=A0AAD3SL47_NEPGR|nr:hypothetical protein Nepgr_014565 [Nepenthes gracilis]